MTVAQRKEQCNWGDAPICMNCKWISYQEKHTNGYISFSKIRCNLHNFMTQQRKWCDKHERKDK